MKQNKTWSIIVTVLMIIMSILIAVIVWMQPKAVA